MIFSFIRLYFGLIIYLDLSSKYTAIYFQKDGIFQGNLTLKE
jgi:hypothetical protein